MQKKTYTITLEEKEGRANMDRVNDGFSPIELLGILEFVQNEIIQQMMGHIKPDTQKRTVIVDDE